MPLEIAEPVLAKAYALARASDLSFPFSVQAALLVAQGLDRIEKRRFPGRIVPEKHTDQG